MYLENNLKSTEDAINPKVTPITSKYHILCLIICSDCNPISVPFKICLQNCFLFLINGNNVMNN